MKKTITHTHTHCVQWNWVKMLNRFIYFLWRCLQRAVNWLSTLTQTCLQLSHSGPGWRRSRVGSSERGSDFSATLSSVGNCQLLFLTGGSKCLPCTLLFACVCACPSSLSVSVWVWGCERTPWHISVSREPLPGITGSTNVRPVLEQQRRRRGQIRCGVRVVSRSTNCSWISRVMVDGII